jgi:sRNA-binding protein
MDAKNEGAPVGRGAEGTDYGRDPTTTIAAALLDRLSAELPVLAEYRPLAIGIHVAMQAAEPGTSPEVVRAALAIHTGHPRYLQALAAGGPRYALDGTVCGEVAESHREAARAKLDRAPAVAAARPVLGLSKARRRA